MRLRRFVKCNLYWKQQKVLWFSWNIDKVLICSAKLCTFEKKITLKNSQLNLDFQFASYANVVRLLFKNLLALSSTLMVIRLT